MNDLIQVKTAADDLSATSINPTAQAIELREKALEAAALVGKVTTSEEQQVAVQAQAGLREIISAVEKTRKSLKAPILDLGRRIDSAAEKFVSEAKAEEIRIARLIGDFQALELARERAAERLRLEEMAKIESERIQAAARVEATKQAELAKLAEQKLSDAERQRLAEVAVAKSHQQLDAIVADSNAKAQALPVSRANRLSGQVVREDWEIEVTDIWLLAKSHPTCVRAEPLLSEIRMLLDAGISVAGIRAKKVVKASYRVGGRTVLDA